MGIFGRKPVTKQEIAAFKRGKRSSARVAKAAADKAERQRKLRNAKAARRRQSR